MAKDSFDDMYIVNYLNSLKTESNIGLPEISTFFLDYQEALLSFAQNKSYEAELKNNLRVKEKYDWLIKYIKS
ncbi:MAG: hypothetical protein HDT42_03020 [Ruminococcaceae bacterium]|nr:hypothetical protein [Oscillospiraceae bacterium]